MPLPPLRPLHPDSFLIALKLEEMGRAQTDDLVESLRPGQKDALKAREDGTILDGHHRIAVLRARGFNVDSLPREIVARTDLTEHETRNQ